MKRVKNNSGSIKVWQGQSIDPGSYYQIQATELYRWQSDSDFLSALGASEAQMNDGTTDMTDVATGMRFLLDTDPTPRDSDGSPIQRGKATQTGWSFQMHGFEFETSNLSSIYSKKYDGSDFSFTTLKLYNGSGTEITDQSVADTDCVTTQIDWEPTHDYEIIGGMLKQVSAPSTDVRLWVVGVPDVPAVYGGSKQFVANVNLKFLASEEGVTVDGRASKYLSYSATYHTNKLRLIVKHDAGIKHRLLMIMEIFKA